MMRPKYMTADLLKEEAILKRNSIIMHADDDVATTLRELSAGTEVHVEIEGKAYDVTLGEDIDFAHKFALRDIAEGEDILKYGLPIGKALEPIKAGMWVHVHNCRSIHFGFHREQYGLKA